MDNDPLYEGSIRQERDRLNAQVYEMHVAVWHSLEKAPRIVRFMARLIIGKPPTLPTAENEQ